MTAGGGKALAADDDARTIDQADLDRLIVTDSAEEAVEAITEIAKRAFGLTYGSRMRRRWFFGEGWCRRSS